MRLLEDEIMYMSIIMHAFFKTILASINVAYKSAVAASYPSRTATRRLRRFGSTPFAVHVYLFTKRFSRFDARHAPGAPA